VGLVSTLVRILAVAASILVGLGFVLFALDESDKGSREQVSKVDDALNTPDPTARQEFLRERTNSELRETIDDANDALLKPFAPLVEDSESSWVRRLVPTGLALLIYGLGGLLLANSLPKPRIDQHDWREAT
jgi:hypothetical protein